jgi:hypothetical protein
MQIKQSIPISSAFTVGILFNPPFYISLNSLSYYLYKYNKYILYIVTEMNIDPSAARTLPHNN